MILPILLGLLPISFCQDGSKGTVITFSIFAVLSLVSNTAPLLFSGNMVEKAQTDDQEVAVEHRRRSKYLCAATFFSNFLLIASAASLAAVLNKKYVIVSSVAGLIFAIFFSYFMVEDGFENGFLWGALQYHTYRPDLKFFFDLSSEVTQSSFAGLAAILFGYVKNGHCQQHIKFRPTEAILLSANVIGLFIMLVCTVPPARFFPENRHKVVVLYLRVACYFLLLLLSLAASFAAMDILGGYIWFSMAITMLPLIFFIVKVYRSYRVVPMAGDVEMAQPVMREINSGPQEGGQDGGEENNVPEVVNINNMVADPTRGRHAAGERSLLWLGIYSLMFGTLMASYSAHMNGQHFSVLHKVVVAFILTVVITNLSRMIIVREAEDYGFERQAVVLSGLGNILSIAVTVILVIFLVMLEPKELISTFLIA